MRITVLGSGTSHGVPFIACDCAVCRSTDPRDKRTRPSILIDLESNATSAVRYVLVDTTPDLRQQCLANDVRRVDAILFTHAHADHICGFDDIRRFNQLQQTPIACYGDEDTLADLRRMFTYVFTGPKQQGGGLWGIESLRPGDRCPAQAGYPGWVLTSARPDGQLGLARRSHRGRYHTDRQPGDAAQYTARCPEAPLPLAATAGGQSHRLQLTTMSPGPHSWPFWHRCG